MFSIIYVIIFISTDANLILSIVNELYCNGVNFHIAERETSSGNKPSPKCPGATKSRDFMIIGHAGGGPNLECENTLEATEAALRGGRKDKRSAGIKSQVITTIILIDELK